jgi:hypothetical protein
MLNNFFNRMYKGASNFVGGITSAVGKIKSFGSAVGKHLGTITQALTPEANENANFSGLSSTMLKITKASYESTRPQNIDGYEYDSELSNSNTAIYHNERNVIIGFRGTVNIDDLITDVSVIKGTADNIRFKQAVEIYNKVKNKYPEKTIMATGHSLGGSLALYLNSLYNIKVETFNPGVGLGFLKSNPNASNATLYVIKGDPISALTGLSSLGTLKVFNPINPEAGLRERHSIKNFNSIS